MMLMQCHGHTKHIFSALCACIHVGTRGSYSYEVKKSMCFQELEKLNDELEKEKARMENFATDMKSEYEKVKK